MSIYPTPGNPNVNATASDQWLIGDPNYNYIGYPGAVNTVSYQLAAGPVTASLGNPSINTGDAAGDTYTDIQNLTGSEFGGSLYGIDNGQTEQLWALGGPTSMFGGTGYTTFIAGDAPDNMFGQTNGGDNLADYEVATSGVTVNLANPSQNAGWAAGDNYSNVHDIAGSAYDDVLIADNNPSANLLGNDGDNMLVAGTGNDTLNGGPGANVFVGGSGADWFIFGGSAIGYNDVTMDPLSILYNAEAGIYSEIYGLNPGSGSQRIDVEPLASSLNESGQPVTSLVQVVEDTSGTFAWLQFNGPSGWVNLAQIRGIQAGQTVGVFDNASDTKGTMLTVQGTPVTTKTNTDDWILANGNWAASLSPGACPGSDEEVVGVGDFTGNGTDDVLWYNTNTGDLSEWQLANGQWSASVDLGAHPGVGATKPGPGWQVEGVGDFTGNGIDDVLWYNAGDNQTDIWELGSNGQWAASVSPGTFPGVGDKVAGIGNFWGNSTSDILWYNEQTGDASDWEISNGQWAASEDIGTHPGSGWQIAGVGNFFGTGLNDVLWYNAGTGQTDVWEIQNGQWAGSTSLGTHPTGYVVAGIGNFAGNANGTTGVLFYNQSTGDLDEWLIANGQWAGSIDLGAHPGGYQVAGVGTFTGNNTADVLFTQHA